MRGPTLANARQWEIPHTLRLPNVAEVVHVTLGAGLD